MLEVGAGWTSFFFSCPKANVMPARMNQPRGCHGQECYQLEPISYQQCHQRSEIRQWWNSGLYASEDGRRRDGEEGIAGTQQRDMGP